MKSDSEVSRNEYPMVNEEILASRRKSVVLDRKSEYIIDDFSLIVPTPMVGLDVDMDSEMKGNFAVVYK